MQNYTSILWVHTNEPIGEKIAVGLLFGNQEEGIFRLNKWKAHALNNLIADVYAVRWLSYDVFPHMEYMAKHDYYILRDEVFSNHHPHGLCFWGKPESVTLEPTEENMLLLFKAMIGKE